MNDDEYHIGIDYVGMSYEDRVKAIEILDSLFMQWEKDRAERESNDRLLTKDHIRKLHTIAKNNINGQSTQPRERTAQKESLNMLRLGLEDIATLIHLGIMEQATPWQGKVMKSPGKNMVISSALWEKTIPIPKVVILVGGLVKLFGMDYARPIARAISEGLQARYDIEDSYTEKDRSVTIEVPIIVKGWDNLQVQYGRL